MSLVLDLVWREHNLGTLEWRWVTETHSTPNNVIIAEAKVVLLRDRGGLLARNLLNKLAIYGQGQIYDKLDSLIDLENYHIFRYPRTKKNIIVEVWETIRHIHDRLGTARGFEIFDANYEAMTRKILVDCEIGYRRKSEELDDGEFVNSIIEKFGLFGSPTIIFYIDGFRSDGSFSTGAGVVVENRDIAYSISLPKECSSFTAEAFAIKTVLDIIYNATFFIEKDIIIFSDCQAVIFAIENNHISVYKNMYIIEIREKVFYAYNRLGKNIVIVWTPAHVGVAGNEMADELAKEGSSEIACDDIMVPLLDFRCVFR